MLLDVNSGYFKKIANNIEIEEVNGCNAVQTTVYVYGKENCFKENAKWGIFSEMMKQKKQFLAKENESNVMVEAIAYVVLFNGEIKNAKKRGLNVNEMLSRLDTMLMDLSVTSGMVDSKKRWYICYDYFRKYYPDVKIWNLPIRNMQLAEKFLRREKQEKNLALRQLGDMIDVEEEIEE